MAGVSCENKCSSQNIAVATVSSLLTLVCAAQTVFIAILMRRLRGIKGSQKIGGMAGQRTQAHVICNAPMTANPDYASVNIQTMDTTDNPAYGLMENFQQHYAVSQL